MIVGVPKEVLEGERRVALTPAGAYALVGNGNQVDVEAGAGASSGFPDEQYRKAGARLCSSAAEVWGSADLIVKVKGPIAQEFAFFREGLVIFSFLHLAASKKLTDVLLGSKAAGIAFETVESDNGYRPILAPMSRIAGRLAVQEGAHLLAIHHGGKGILLGGTAGVAPARVVILGGGESGMAACRLAVAMGAAVFLLDIDLTRLTRIAEMVSGNLITLYASSANLAEQVEKADLVVGAVYVSGAKAPRLVSRELVRRMEPGSVVADLSIDQGGCFETSRPTSLEAPTYLESGVIHYCVINMPALVPRTATLALSNVTLPYLLKIASLGYEKAVAEDNYLKRGINIARGEIVHPGLAASFNQA
ncbi:MAG: alanine dehydrogenase [Thermodesulfobacteriota bacterium]